MSYKDAKGWIKADEREFLFAQAARAQGTILTVGVEYGASLCCLQEGNGEQPIIAIDIDLDKMAAPWGARTISVQGDSQQIAPDWPEMSASLGLSTPDLAFVFIDGDHGYDSVTADALFADYLVVGGVMAFHDCYSWDVPLAVHQHSPGVNIAVNNWLLLQPEGKWRELPVVDSIRAFERVL